MHMANGHGDIEGAIQRAKRFARKLRKATPRTVANKLGFFYIRNRHIAKEASQCALYRKFERQYRDVLEAPVEAGEQRRSRKVWVCWLQGFDSAPDLVKACLNSLKRNLSGYEIVELDESNLREYAQLPDYIEAKYRAGIITRAHYTDLLRVDLLCRHGGIWIDSTVLCTSPDLMPVVENAPLFVFKEYKIAPLDQLPIVASSWFVGAVSNHPILLLTRKLLYAYWRRENVLREYYTFHLFFAMAARRFPEEWRAVPPYNNISPFVLRYEIMRPDSQELWERILSFSSFHKLSYRHDFTGDGNNLYAHILREYLPERSEGAVPFPHSQPGRA